MKYNFRRPSLNKKITSRTSIKRILRHNLGLKVPKGYGWITDPKKSLYNYTYNRLTFNVEKLLRKIIK